MSNKKTMQIADVIKITPIENDQPLTDESRPRLNRQSKVDWVEMVDDLEAWMLVNESELGIKLYQQYKNDEIDEQEFFRELYFIMYNEIFD
jgi:hypothetical protein